MIVPPPGSDGPQRAICNKCQKNCGAYYSLDLVGGVLTALIRTERRTKQLWLVGLVCAEAGLRCERDYKLHPKRDARLSCYRCFCWAPRPPLAHPFFPTSVLSFVFA